MSDAIERVRARAFQVPTDKPESDGTLAWDSTTCIVVELNSNNEVGIGYTYSDVVAASLINRKYAPLIEGQSVWDSHAILSRLSAESRNLGTRGIVACALSAIDVALWDLRAKKLQSPLVDVLGRCRSEVPIYGSGGFTSYSPGELQEQLAGWLEQGIRRVKMKVGREPTADLARVQIARDAIGPNVELFVDANGAYSRKQALSFANQYAELGVSWFEEPVSSDDLDGLRLLRNQSPAPIRITAGEYGFDPIYFRRMLEAEAVDVLMADATRCGGISGFLQAASIGWSYQVPVSAHTAPWLHSNIAAALQNVVHIEYFHDHSRLEQLLFAGVAEPVEGQLVPNLDRYGLGIQVKQDAAQQFEIT